MTGPSSGRGGSLWVAIERAAQQLFWLVLFVIMAPILGPHAYGQFALVMVFIGFCELILIEAAVEALVCLDDAARDHIRTATLVNGAVALVVGAAAWLLAEPFARAFDDPELAALARALAPLPLLSALTAAPIGMLRRARAFRPLALRSIIGLASGAVVGIAAALTGHGVWALVLQTLVQRMVELVVLWVAEPSAIGIGWSRTCWADMAHFARNVTISCAMYWMTGQAPRLVIGYLLGPVALGLFTLAGRASDVLLQIAVLPRTIVARIELIADRAEPARFEHRLQAMTREAALIAFPTAIGAAAVMPQLFALWLDARWLDGLAATQLMLLTAIPLLGFFACTAGLMAANRPDLEARISAWQSVSNTLVTLATAWLGLTIVTAAMLVRLVVLLPLAVRRLSGAASIRAATMIEGTLPILIAATVMGAITYATDRFVPLPGAAALRLVLLVVEGVVLYLAALYVIDRRLITLLVQQGKTIVRRP
jgi:PST family polysaccharide transporter